MDTKIRRLFRNSPILPMSQVFFIAESFAQNQFVVKQGEVFNIFGDIVVTTM